jgi:hypothetical protein
MKSLRTSQLLMTSIISVTFLLGACGQGTSGQKKKTASDLKRTVCVFEVEKLGMQRGVQARQLVVDGVVARAPPVVYWSTPDFTGVSNRGAQTGQAPYLQVLLGWRIGAREGAAESPLDGMILRAKDLAPSAVPAGSKWRISIIDDEQHEVEYEAPSPGKPIEARLTPEGGGGQILPDIIAEALGGINGGRFEVALVDQMGSVIASRDVRPLRGYEFKELGERAIEGVKDLAKQPESCTTPATF